jgi:predicted lipid-binding transport protein (Tim44 family)
MTSETWLRDHESLAALVFIILSLALIAVFTWVERRFFQKYSAPSFRDSRTPPHSATNKASLS